MAIAQGKVILGGVALLGALLFGRKARAAKAPGFAGTSVYRGTLGAEADDEGRVTFVDMSRFNAGLATEGTPIDLERARTIARNEGTYDTFAPYFTEAP